MSEITDARELTDFGRTDVENEMQEVMDAVLKEPQIPTMGKKLIVEGSTPGHFPGCLWEHFGIKDAPPHSIEEQAVAIIECVKAGAAAIHSHPRDPEDKYRYVTHSGKGESSELMVEILDKVYKAVDFVPLNHAFYPKDWQDLAEPDFITPVQELLDMGKGNKYIQGSIVIAEPGPNTRKGLLSAWFTVDGIRKGIAFLEENHIKPLIALPVTKLTWFKNNVIDAGVFKTAPHINIQEAKHGVNNIFADPMSHITIVNSIEMVKKLVPDCTIGLHVAGRNWLPMTVLGIMLGVDLVRIGLEDQFWTYPHKDDFVRKASEHVEKVVQIAKALGRDIATPDEARKIMGIKATSGR
ncbi:3-keto-5-aminohexanoate cleavage protein [Chloroflexota bacterium]